jgi:hypothetical protein
MSRSSGSSLSIVQVVHGIQDKAVTQKDSAIDKLFVQTSNVRLKYGTIQLLTKAAIQQLSRLQNRTADRDTARGSLSETYLDLVNISVIANEVKQST